MRIIVSSIENINVNLGNFILDIPKIELLDEGVTAISGPSGSGKTTFFKVLFGLHQPKNWKWIFKGEDLAKLSIADRRLGVVFQGDELFPHLTAEENVLIVAKARKADLHQLEKYVERLNLKKSWMTKASLLSGGEKQRVSLLRALMSNSRIILMDEPFSALDTNNKEESRKLVKDLLTEFKIPAYMISHDTNDVKILAEKVIYFELGRVINSSI